MNHSTFTFRHVHTARCWFSLAILTLLPNLISASTATAADAVLVAFTSQHCGPCRDMQPIVAQVERSGVPVRSVDVADEPQLAMRFGIRSTPTYVVLVAGKEVTRLSGPQTLADLRQALATKASGPLIQTGSDWKPERPSAASFAAAAPAESFAQATGSAPQTRLAMLTSEFGSPLGHAGTSAAGGAATAALAPSEAMPNAAIADAVQRAEAATVRLRVFEGQGFGVGTGTIIDTHGDEALVLTCGHLFRETKGQGRIDVDLFVAGDVKTVPGQVIGYDADNRDIAVVAIRPGYPVQPVPLIQAGQAVRTGQTAFSFGCDRGDPPSRRDTRITGVNKYNQHLGVSNLEIAGAPIDGRSGGGLFDDQGRLIGVCNAADYQEDLGIYAGPGSVHWQLDQVNLAHLYQGSPTQPADTLVSAPERIASLPATPPPVVQASATELTAPATFSSPAALATGGATASGREVIVIIRDRANPQGPATVKTITEPTTELMQMIDRHGR